MKGCFALRKMTTKPLQGIIDTNLMHPTDLFKFLRRGYEFDTKDYNVFLLDKNKFCGYCFCKKK
jgi:hypothetical protein